MQTAGRVALIIGGDTRAFLGVVRSLRCRAASLHFVPFDFASPALLSRHIAQIHGLPSLQAGGDAGGRRGMMGCRADRCRDVPRPRSQRASVPIRQ